jgi:hypothetical protein
MLLLALRKASTLCWKKNGRRTDRAKIASTATSTAIHHLSSIEIV